jgi:outer membrane lipoprotein-sorting protein
MNDFSDQELIRRLERLGAIEPLAEGANQALNRVRRALIELPEIAPASRIAPGRRNVLRRVAIAALVVVGIGGLFTWLWRSPSAARAGFAEVQAAMKAARSATFRQIVRQPGKPEETTRTLILGEGLARVVDSDGSYTVIDTAKYRVLLVNPKKREATLMRSVNLPQVNLYERIKDFPSDASARALGAKKIDGQDALGFVVKVEGHDLTVWADAATRLPLRIEAEEKDDKGRISELVIDQFVFDRELDSRLFSLEAPAGYQLEIKGIADFPAAPADPQLKDLVVTPLMGIGPVKFRMAREDVEKLLGKPDAVVPRGNSGYVELNYGSRGFFLGVSKTLGVINIMCVAQKVMAIRVRDFSGKTDRGIALGATSADIIRAYGQPTSKETRAGSTYLVYGKLEAEFMLVGDKLVQMMFKRPRQ